MPAYELLNLNNINAGAVPESFAVAWEEILKDIADEQKPAEAVRSMTIKIKVTPSKTRGQVGIDVGVETKLPSRPSLSATGFAYLKLDDDDGSVSSFVNNPSQESLNFSTQGHAQEEHA